MVMTAHWFGDRAVRIDDADYRFAPALRALLPDLSIRVGISSLLAVSPAPDAGLLERVATALAGATAIDDSAGAEQVVIDISYDGADLVAVSQALGCSVSDVVAAHQQQSWRVAMVGFAPGFGYLVPEGVPVLDWACVPRLASPRPRVPAGSVAIAAGMSAVYPSAMPGGWNLIGTSTALLFDLARVGRESLLVAGATVRFERRA